MAHAYYITCASKVILQIILIVVCWLSQGASVDGTIIEDSTSK